MPFGCQGLVVFLGAAKMAKRRAASKKAYLNRVRFSNEPYGAHFTVADLQYLVKRWDVK